MPEPAWPADALARYLTVVGETVDLRATAGGHRYDCAGCGHTWTHPSEGCLRRNARAHAAKCSAVPRPTS